MAYAMTKQGSLDNCITYEFMCDTVADMNAIENKYRTIGTVAIVLSGESGMEVYIAGSDKQWNSLSSIGGGTAGGNTAGLAIYICAQNEVSNGLPDVELPDETTIYLVPTSDASSGNLYDEYIYVDDEWEKFGSSGTTIDLSGYYQKPVSGIPASDLASGVVPDVSGFAPKNSPIFTGSISLGRAANSTIGNYSVAVGDGVTASGNWSYAEGNTTTASAVMSHAEGNTTIASGAISHAEGNTTTASGAMSHAEGQNTTASGTPSHAEGYGTIASISCSHSEGSNTQAAGYCSHTEGLGTIANLTAMHASGEYNTIYPDWISGTSYEVDDLIIYNSGLYKCTTANSDTTFNYNKWLQSDIRPIFVIGNGSQDDSRSNACTINTDGNEYLMGDIYVGCNADSTGGTKLPRIPEAPSIDGTYILQATVTNGTPTYTWVSLSSLSGVTF